jgi:hypothetical protein
MARAGNSIVVRELCFRPDINPNYQSQEVMKTVERAKKS